jgi:hypothetical protein
MSSPTVYNIYRNVAPSDTVDLPQPSDAVWVGGAGNVAAVMQDGTVSVFTAVPAGVALPIKARRINATLTTATLLVALYDR